MMNANAQAMDYPVYVSVPLDPETSPEAIERRHRREVKAMLDHGFDAETISMTLTLPIWNVRRAIHFFETGKKLAYPKARIPIDRKREKHQYPSGVEKFKPLKPWKTRCPKTRSLKSLESPGETPKRKRGRPRKNPLLPSGISADGIATSRKAKNPSGGKPTDASMPTKRPKRSRSSLTLAT